MDDKQPNTNLQWHSLDKEEQETLKRFFALLHRIDCRLKREEKRYESSEDHQIRNQSDQT